MEVVDPGHRYLLASFDGGEEQLLRFMKRQGPGYPFNVGEHPGTNCQEVLRALIARVKYLDRQIHCAENYHILANLRSALLMFEARAARRHDRALSVLPIEIELEPTCGTCGHIGCSAHT